MRHIPLTQGKVALIDDEDYNLISQFKWCAAKKSYIWYAVRGIKLGVNRRSTQHMHSLLTGWWYVDHIDGDGLNNQRVNLRESNHTLNMLNQHRMWGASKYKGVSWATREQKWCARIRISGMQKHVGYFQNEEEAAKAYDDAIYDLLGNSVKLNFPRKGEDKK